MTASLPQADTLNMRIIGHSDLAGAGDGMLVNVQGGIAFVGHMGESRVGTSIVDVQDPTRPRVLHQILTPAGTHSHKVQVVDDVLVVNYERNGRETADRWEAGLKVFDVSNPREPQEIGFLHTPGKGVHRVTYWEPPYAYLSGSDEGYVDQFLIIADLSDPSRPREAGRWWFPGMHVGGGEVPEWSADRRYAAHHAVVEGERAYCGWWDAGVVILDLSDVERPSLVSHTPLGEDSRKTHTALPIPGRDLVVTTDEVTEDNPREHPDRHVRVLDIADEQHPTMVSRFPVPEGDFRRRAGRFGPHNLHEHRPGSLRDPDRVYLTYFNAGIRVVNIEDPANPFEEAYCVPEAPPGRDSIQLNDLTVAEDGLVYVTDRYTGGLYVLAVER